jgi:hypothetical protein
MRFEIGLSIKEIAVRGSGGKQLGQARGIGGRGARCGTIWQRRGPDHLILQGQSDNRYSSKDGRAAVNCSTSPEA